MDLLCDCVWGSFMDIQIKDKLNQNKEDSQTLFLLDNLSSRKWNEFRLLSLFYISISIVFLILILDVLKNNINEMKTIEEWFIRSLLIIMVAIGIALILINVIDFLGILYRIRLTIYARHLCLRGTLFSLMAKTSKQLSRFNLLNYFVVRNINLNYSDLKYVIPNYLFDKNLSLHVLRFCTKQNDSYHFVFY